MTDKEVPGSFFKDSLNTNRARLLSEKKPLWPLIAMYHETWPLIASHDIIYFTNHRKRIIRYICFHHGRKLDSEVGHVYTIMKYFVYMRSDFHFVTIKLL